MEIVKKHIKIAFFFSLFDLFLTWFSSFSFSFRFYRTSIFHIYFFFIFVKVQKKNCTGFFSSGIEKKNETNFFFFFHSFRDSYQFLRLLLVCDLDIYEVSEWKEIFRRIFVTLKNEWMKQKKNKLKFKK